LCSLAAQQDIDLKKPMSLSAGRTRRQRSQSKTIDYFTAKYKDTFGHLLFTEHLPNLPGEIAGKHTNERWAATYFKKHYIDVKNSKLKLET
jgi:hypothetical protein